MKLKLIIVLMLFAQAAFGTLLSDYQLRNDPLVRARVTSAILLAAANIKTEASNTTNHTERLAWAQSLIGDGEAEAMARRFMVNVAANATISGAYDDALDHTDITDNDLIFTVNGLVDQYALELFPADPAP